MTPIQKSLPAIGGVFIGIPRQQAVCMSEPNTIIMRWGNVSAARMWRTTNAGDSWIEMAGARPASIAHDHLAVWNDTTYNFAGAMANGFDELIVNPDGTRNTIINQPLTNLGNDQVIFSGQPANLGNDMVGLARNGTQGQFWYLSHDRGRTWIDKGRGPFPNQAGINGRIGITWNPPDTAMALSYARGSVSVFYYQPHDSSWVRHGASRFNITDMPDRFFSGVICGGYTYIAGYVHNGYNVWRARAHTNDTAEEIPLYAGTTPSNPYIALQEIKSINGIMAYYLHGNGSLWGRLYYDGSWSPETFLSSVSFSNITAPFQVPPVHGARGYLFGNSPSGEGYMVMVNITGAVPDSIPVIHVTSPNGNENWLAGSSQNITWTSQYVTGNVGIDYSTDNGVNWLMVTSSTADSGSYSWVVPDTPSNVCLVRVSQISGGTASDQSDAVFIIHIEIPGCTYVPGDINDNGFFSGLDVVYGVSYFKGGLAPPYLCECTPGNIWYLAGDVNASCTFTGSDISYMVSFFKGGPAPAPCPDCPPSEILRKPLPGQAPTPAIKPIGVPILKSNKNSMSGN